MSIHPVKGKVIRKNKGKFFIKRVKRIVYIIVFLLLCTVLLSSCNKTRGQQDDQMGNQETGMDGVPYDTGNDGGDNNSNGDAVSNGGNGNNGNNAVVSLDPDGVSPAGDAGASAGNSQELRNGIANRGEILSIQEQISMFREAADSLPLDNVESATELLKIFKSLVNLGIPNDDLFHEYEETMQIVAENLNSTLEDMDVISDDLIVNALENGFLFVGEDDYPHFILRADFFCDTFFDYLSDQSKELVFYRKKHYLFAEGHDMIENSTLMISWDQLAEMIIDWEGFLSRHADSDSAADIVSNLDFYLKLYIGSVQIDNSGLFDHVGDDPSGEPILVLNVEPKESYIRFTENYKDSSYYPIIKGLLDVYAQDDFVYSERIVEYYESQGLDLEW